MDATLITGWEALCQQLAPAFTRPTFGFSDDLSADDKSARVRVATFELESLEASVLVIVSGAPNGLYESHPPGSGQPGSTGAYDLVIDVQPIEVSKERVLNDAVDPENAVTLAPGERVTLEGMIGDGLFAQTKGDADFYAIEPIDGGVLEVDVDAAVNGSELDSFVAAYFLGNVRIAHNDNDGQTVDSRMFVPIPCLAERQSIYDRQVFIGVTGTGHQVTPSHVNATAVPLYGRPFTRPARHEVREHTGSTGEYQLHLTLHAVDECGEPNSPLEPIETGLTDEGVYFCDAYLGDEPDNSCPAGQDRDAWAFTVQQAPVLLELSFAACDLRRTGICLELYREDAKVAEWPPPVVNNVVAREPVVLSEPGRYRILATANCGVGPREACAPVDVAEDYSITLRLSPVPAPLQSSMPPPPAEPRVFATLLDPVMPAIVELHPTTGRVVNAFDAPEAFYGAAEGLAYDGQVLYYLGSGRYPLVYRLDPEDGRILDARELWVGTGYFTDVLVRGDELLILDVFEHALYAFPLDLARSRDRLDPLAASRIALTGGLASRWDRGPLVGLDGFFNERIYRIDGESGEVLETIEPGGACRCLGDLDGDHDVDDDDVATFDRCVSGEGQPFRFGCGDADLDCDADVDEADAEILGCQSNGPRMPPKEGCCPPDLPRAGLRLTDIGGGATGVILAADWASNQVRLLGRDGCAFQTWELEHPVGAITGSAIGRLGDADEEGDIDLDDYAAFAPCLEASGPGIDPGAECLRVFDFDEDGDVDLGDFHEFGLRFTGGSK